jgi:hypothetical protein
MGLGRGGNFQFVAIRANEIADEYAEVGFRAQHLAPAFQEALKLLERDEALHFRRMRGRYVLTGQTIESLTLPDGAGAIREVHSGRAVFGTRVPQAHYLTKSPHDPENEQVLKHNGHRSAVLVSKAKTRKAIARQVLDHMTEDFG